MEQCNKTSKTSTKENCETYISPPKIWTVFNVSKLPKLKEKKGSQFPEIGYCRLLLYFGFEYCHHYVKKYVEILQSFVYGGQ